MTATVTFPSRMHMGSIAKDAARHYAFGFVQQDYATFRAQLGNGAQMEGVDLDEQALAIATDTFTQRFEQLEKAFRIVNSAIGRIAADVVGLRIQAERDTLEQLVEDIREAIHPQDAERANMQDTDIADYLTTLHNMALLNPEKAHVTFS